LYPHTRTYTHTQLIADMICVSHSEEQLNDWTLSAIITVTVGDS